LFARIGAKKVLNTQKNLRFMFVACTSGVQGGARSATYCLLASRAASSATRDAGTTFDQTILDDCAFTA
jgi:hypothetical protein